MARHKVRREERELPHQFHRNWPMERIAERMAEAVEAARKREKYRTRIWEVKPK